MRISTQRFSSAGARRWTWSPSQRTLGVLTILALLVLWEFASWAGWVNPYSLPRPSRLVGSLWTLMTVGFPRNVTVWQHIYATLGRIFTGYFIAALFAVPLGILVGQSRFLDRATNPVVTFARSVATISLLPLFVTWFGIGELSKVLLVGYACFWIIFTNTVEGVKQVDPDLIRAAKVLQTRPGQMFTRVIFPAALPRIVAGMHIALGVSFAVIVAVEMVGTIEGLGALIMESRTLYRSDVAMVGMIFIALFGLILTNLLVWSQRFFLPWASSIEEVER